MTLEAVMQGLVVVLAALVCVRIVLFSGAKAAESRDEAPEQHQIPPRLVQGDPGTLGAREFVRSSRDLRDRFLLGYSKADGQAITYESSEIATHGQILARISHHI